jgi:DNA helicase-2/ATP-dependent DNA helicase PcrA
VLGLRTEAAPACPGPAPSTASARGCCASTPPQIGLDENFTIHDRGDAEDLMGLVRHELGFSETTKRFPLKGTCVGIYSRTVNTAIRWPRCCSRLPLVRAWENELKRLFAAYVEAKQQQNVLDYDDLLLYWADMVAEPALAAQIGARFDHVLVDEYQDTNRLQVAILLALKPDGAGSPWSATMRSRSTPSAAPPCATSSTFRRSSRSRRASSRWSATTARRSRSSTCRMR